MTLGLLWLISKYSPTRTKFKYFKHAVLTVNMFLFCNTVQVNSVLILTYAYNVLVCIEHYAIGSNMGCASILKNAILVSFKEEVTLDF